MNIVILFAGGTGQRMNTRTVPKQFLELHGKPILIYTVEQFQQHPLIDGIIVVMLEDRIEKCHELVKRYYLDKVAAIVPGGNSGQASIYNGLKKAAELYPLDATVLIHDGVRPLIDAGNITAAIECVKEHGSAITAAPAIETITMADDNGKVEQIIERSKCKLAKAPQCFVLGDILTAHERARKEGQLDFIDSASMMQHYGYDLFIVEGSQENIKITTPSDFYTFRAIIDARENSQIFGI